MTAYGKKDSHSVLAERSVLISFSLRLSPERVRCFFASRVSFRQHFLMCPFTGRDRVVRRNAGSGS